jgi:hypothetical protein
MHYLLVTGVEEHNKVLVETFLFSKKTLLVGKKYLRYYQV